MYSSPVTRIALGNSELKSCLNCPGPNSDCHIWGCALDLTKVGPTNCDRNGFFFIVKQPDGTAQLQSYPDTKLCPVGQGQAGPGYCVTATTRADRSQLSLQKCDSALRLQQNLHDFFAHTGEIDFVDAADPL